MEHLPPEIIWSLIITAAGIFLNIGMNYQKLKHIEKAVNDKLDKEVFNNHIGHITEEFRRVAHDHRNLQQQLTSHIQESRYHHE